jgi:iron complex outermembrane recepter protein
MRIRERRKALLAWSAFFVLLSAVSANAQSAPVYQFDIPSEKLAQALKDFSTASSQQILFSDNVIGDRVAPALHGSFTRDQALAILLLGSDLRADVSKTGVIMVRPKNAQAASNEGAANSSTGAIETVVVTGTSIRGVPNPTTSLWIFVDAAIH